MKTIPSSTKKDATVHPQIFFISAGLIVLFVLATLVSIGSAEAFFSTLQSAIARYARWLLILAVNVYLLFIGYLLLSRFANIRLGGPKAQPEFSRISWFAMLFSAGMGIGLLFYSVAEPMFHLVSPPLENVEPNSHQAAATAMAITFYHWGLHAWGIYALVGLALAFFSFNRNLPLTIRSAFEPLLGDRINGPLGYAIDILAVVATLFGVATSLGLGVQQVHAGLDHLFGIGPSIFWQFVLIAIITTIATISVVSGLDKGVRRLSEINLVAAGLLGLFVLTVGPTVFQLNGFVQNTGYYIQQIVRISTWTEAYQQTNWQESWTVFYWAWWIAWSPFVGMFIARISKGRTIREFLIGVLAVPTLCTFLWLSIFGNAAIHREIFGAGGLADIAISNTPVALFTLLEGYPMATFSSLLAVIVVVIFFVTSSDSGSLVIDIITAGGHTNPPVRQRIFWAVLEGVVAAVLLAGGGLVALQTGAITTGLPFSIVLLLLCVSLYRGLRQTAIVNESD